MTPRLFYTLSEFSEQVGSTERALIDMAAQGTAALSVWFDGMLFRVDERGFCFVDFRCGLMVLPPHQALKFLFEDAAQVTYLTCRLPCEDVLDRAIIQADGIPEPYYQDNEFACIPRLACRPFCKRVDFVPSSDKREFFVQVGRTNEYLATPDPPEAWQMEDDKFPVYQMAALCVSTREAKRLQAVYFARQEQAEESAPSGVKPLRNHPGTRVLNPKKEKTLLKIIGALIRIHYDKDAYKMNGKFNALAIESSIKQHLSTDEGLKDKTIRIKIPQALEAIEENFLAK